MYICCRGSSKRVVLRSDGVIYGLAKALFLIWYHSRIVLFVLGTLVTWFIYHNNVLKWWLRVQGIIRMYLQPRFRACHKTQLYISSVNCAVRWRPTIEDPYIHFNGYTSYVWVTFMMLTAYHNNLYSVLKHQVLKEYTQIMAISSLFIIVNTSLTVITSSPTQNSVIYSKRHPIRPYT